MISFDKKLFHLLLQFHVPRSLLICECIFDTFILAALKLLILMTLAHKSFLSFVKIWPTLRYSNFELDNQNFGQTTRCSQVTRFCGSQIATLLRRSLSSHGSKKSKEVVVKEGRPKVVVPLQFLSVVNGPSHQSRSYFFCYGIWNGKKISICKC